MKFLILDINKTPLHIAVLKKNINLIKLLLKQKGIDINVKSVLIFFFYHVYTFYLQMRFYFQLFYEITKLLFSYYI